jgi:MYXO-CTERM domain-containing protein
MRNDENPGGTRDALGVGMPNSCTYHNSYYAPGIDGACGAETMVPEGCPLHVATPAGLIPRFEVFRGTESTALPSTTMVVDTIVVPMNRIDPYDCDCASVASAASFDRHAVVLTGAVDGDVVAFDAARLDEDTTVVIGPAGPCPAPAWPSSYSVLTTCDVCPPVDDGGCAASTGTSSGGPLVIALLLGVFIARRRR